MDEGGIGPKSLMERSNGCRELGHYSAMCSRFDASGSAVMRCDVPCRESIPLSGVSYFPFYRPRESMSYRWEKRGKREAKEALQGHRIFLFLHVGPTDMAGGDRNSPMLDAYLLTLIGPHRAPVR